MGTMADEAHEHISVAATPERCLEIAIDYERYNSPERNAFFKVPPEIEFRSQ